MPLTPILTRGWCALLLAVFASACGPPDADEDGYLSAARGGDDCDDANPEVNPGSVEICDPDSVDENCDGSTNGPDALGQVNWLPDTDADGFGDASAPLVLSCAGLPGYVQSGGDCDDKDDTISPAATEVCDSSEVDEDCDGLVDDLDPSTDLSTGIQVYSDNDDDGDGAGTALFRCAPADGQSVIGADCDDNDPSRSSVATEVCDDRNIDEDCDALADDQDPNTDPSTSTQWYADADRDGYGALAAPGAVLCDDPSTKTAAFSGNSLDCDDSRSEVNPGAEEVCDDAGFDEDCDGIVDEADACVPDTGIATVFVAGEAVVDLSTGAFTSGRFGAVVADAVYLPKIQVLCSDMGEWTDAGGNAPAGCPSCDWSFNLRVDGQVADGSYCEALGFTGGELDGAIYSFGFAEHYTYYSGSTAIELEQVVFYFYEGPDQWYLFSYNYGGAGYNSGDASSMSFYRYSWSTYFYR